MSKLNVGVGEDFPLGDNPERSERGHVCGGRHWRHRGRHRHHGPGAAIIIVPAAVASITAAVLYPLATLGVIGGAGLAAAAYKRGRWHHYRDEYIRRWREEQRSAQEGPQPDRPRDEPPAPPKETI